MLKNLKLIYEAILQGFFYSVPTPKRWHRPVLKFFAYVLYRRLRFHGITDGLRQTWTVYKFERGHEPDEVLLFDPRCSRWEVRNKVQVLSMAESVKRLPSGGSVVRVRERSV